MAAVEVTYADELRGACESFKAETVSFSSVERLLTAIELIADRMDGDGNVIEFRAGGGHSMRVAGTQA